MSGAGFRSDASDRLAVTSFQATGSTSTVTICGATGTITSNAGSNAFVTYGSVASLSPQAPEAPQLGVNSATTPLSPDVEVFADVTITAYRPLLKFCWCSGPTCTSDANFNVPVGTITIQGLLALRLQVYVEQR